MTRERTQIAAHANDDDDDAAEEEQEQGAAGAEGHSGQVRSFVCRARCPASRLW